MKILQILCFKTQFKMQGFDRITAIKKYLEFTLSPGLTNTTTTQFFNPTGIKVEVESIKFLIGASPPI